MIFWVFVLMCTNIVNHGAAKSDSVTVETDNGAYVGRVRRFKAFGNDVSVRRFFGIPFAEPPVGDLRFKRPVKKAKLETPLDASEYGPVCMQQRLSLGGKRKPGRYESLKMSEDCLYLNIFTPDNVDSSKELLPVLIYIHGGGFVFGAPMLYPQDIMSVYGNVVAVTIAYRLSIWGFLSTGDQELPGNYGLWDQHKAIQWVHDNIQNFGGDPNSVTLYGTSAGGSSVVYQGMYPGNQGLVHRVISQSGSVTNVFALNKDVLPATVRLGKLVGCSDETTKELADCLKAMPSEKLFEVVNTEESGFLYVPFDFVPNVDGEFIPETPADIFNGRSDVSEAHRAMFSGIDLMIGLTDGDGFIRYSDIWNISDIDAYDVTRETFETELVPDIIRAFFKRDDAPDVLRDVVIGEYTDWDQLDDVTSPRDAFVKIATDYMFAANAIETARVHTRTKNSRKNTYVYLYSAFPSQRLFAVPVWANKAQHVDEMTTLLGYDNEDGFTSWTTPYTEDSPPDWELELSKAHINMWANFARTGNPNGPADVQTFMKTEWPAYSVDSEGFINIAGEMSPDSAGYRPFAREANFWLNVLPGVIKAVEGKTGKMASGKNEFCERDQPCKP